MSGRGRLWGCRRRRLLPWYHVVGQIVESDGDRQTKADPRCGRNRAASILSRWRTRRSEALVKLHRAARRIEVRHRGVRRGRCVRRAIARAARSLPGAAIRPIRLPATAARVEMPLRPRSGRGSGSDAQPVHGGETGGFHAGGPGSDELQRGRISTSAKSDVSMRIWPGKRSGREETGSWRGLLTRRKPGPATDEAGGVTLCYRVSMAWIPGACWPARREGLRCGKGTGAANRFGGDRTGGRG